jgi:hypothetical protein
MSDPKGWHIQGKLFRQQLSASLVIAEGEKIDSSAFHHARDATKSPSRFFLPLNYDSFKSQSL